MKHILSRVSLHNVTRSQRILYGQSFKLLSTKKMDHSEPRSASILGDELSSEYALDRASPISPDEFVGVKGHSSLIDKADFGQARIGDVLEIPYEVTASDFWRV